MSFLSGLTDAELARYTIELLDLTSLNEQDTEDDITYLCEQAQQGNVQVAALCIYPRFIPWARSELARLGIQGVKLATVSNFPHGRSDIAATLAETSACLAYGADEVDLVFPYASLMAGNEVLGEHMVRACKALCGTKILKVIIESGELASPALIAQASDIAIHAGADFIKTSTGKVPVNATPAAAKVMLEQIKQANHLVGFKAAGGVKTLAGVRQYLTLAVDVLGDDVLQASRFRVGTSALLGALLVAMGESADSAPTGDY